MTEEVIDPTKYYGRQDGDNGCVIAFTADSTQYVVAVAYRDGVLVVVPEPELRILLNEASSFGRLLDRMAKRLGMARQTIEYEIVPGTITYATMISDNGGMGGFNLDAAA